MTMTISQILEDFSVEMTGKDVDALHEARPYLPAGTRVNVTFLGNEDLAMRKSAARTVKESGLKPVPHISARRINSRAALEEVLNALHADGTNENVFVIAGDPSEPEGPYNDALALINDTDWATFGVRSVGISGYPDGHSDISRDQLWAAIENKAAALKEQANAGDIITQFGFDVDPLIEWIEAVRDRGIDIPIRVGVPGPAGVKRLLSYARRFGVASSAGIAKKYGFSLTNLLATTGPDRFITELASRLDPARHGTVKLHFFTFGGLRTTAEWVRDFDARSRPEVPAGKDHVGH